MTSHHSFLTRALEGYARFVVNHAGKVLLLLLALAAVSGVLASKLRIESDQLKLISQDLQEVKDVHRVVDMVGGAGYLMLALRSSDEPTLKRVADDLAAMLTEDKENVRFVTYKVPVEFVQKNMVLFIDTEDLAEAKKRINAYIKDQIRRNNPFNFDLTGVKREPVKLELQDLIDKYSKVGEKSIRDDYYISDDRQMMMMLIKPMWNTTELPRTRAFLATLSERFADYEKRTGTRLVEDYDKLGDSRTVFYGYTGSYKFILDDSYAIDESLSKVWGIALAGIVLVALIFFRKLAPSVITITGMALGTILTLGFAKLALGELNMVTSMIGAILMGFGIDYGIHFVFRTRIELGQGKDYRHAIHDALVYAGRPALVAAVVTAGSFFVLLISGFRGFSQFGFLAGCGTLILGISIFSWCAAILLVLGRKWPDLPRRLVGTMKLGNLHDGGIRIPRPGLLLTATSIVVLGACAFAIPWSPGAERPKDREPTLVERLKSGITFDYNTRSLMPKDQPSVKLNDEINRRFRIASDPIAVYTRTVEEARELYDELTLHKEKYPAVAQVVSIYSFVPPKKTAEANAKILEEWEQELADLDPAMLPPDVQDKAALFKEILSKRPFDVDQVPEIYASLFRHLPTTQPENHGYLTFLYPSIDLWNGKNLLQFSDQTAAITTASGKTFRSAGLATLYAKLARIVLWDGKVTVILAALWILLMHYLDFRSVPLALASVIPLCVGVLMMLGIMSIVDHRLNFMNMIILPILLGFGVSHGLYLLHRFLEGVSPVIAFRSVGAAVAASTLTAITGFASLLFASHSGLNSMGFVACLGLTTTLLVSFAVLAPVLQLIHDGRMRKPRAEEIVEDVDEAEAPDAA
ncbi:MAG TPA: MMPL family transporter [Myxococcaceae bacterium]|nr:MMPL family transporter [Myxococcaceae bacterium]